MTNPPTNYVHRGKPFPQPTWSGKTLLEDVVDCLPVINDPDQLLDLNRRLRERDRVKEVDGPDGWHVIIAPQPRHYRTMRVVAVSNVPPTFLPDLLKKLGRLLTDDGACGVGVPAEGGLVRSCLTLSGPAGLDLFDVRPGDGDEVRMFLRSVRNHDPLPPDCTQRVYEAMREDSKGATTRVIDETPARCPAMIPHPGRYTTSKRRDS